MKNAATVVVGLWASMGSSLLAQPLYTISDLGGAGDLGTTHASGVNDKSQVVGEYSPLFGSESPFFWEGGEMTVLEPLPGDSRAQARAINNAGRIVGESDGKAFLWHDGVMIDLGMLPGTTNAYALDINDASQVTGYSGDTGDGDPENHAFIWQSGAMIDLGVPNGFRSSYGFGINNLGQVVGRAYLIDSADHHASLYSEGVWTDLGTLDDDALSEAKDINDLGQIVGFSREMPGTDWRPFLWEDGVMIGLDVPRGFEYGFPLAINNAGTIVGYGDRESGGIRAVVWIDGTMYDLNDLLVPDAAWPELSIAEDINDAGQIVGQGTNPDGEGHAFLLTPIVEDPCEGDANGDGTVDPLDTGFVMARFGCSVNTGDPDCDTADQNADGLVNPLDAGFILSRFGPCE